MSASRWSRPTITRRCMALICCGNRNPASRASDVDEASRCLPRRDGCGDLGARLCPEPDPARQIFAGADDGVAILDRGGAVPVRAAAEGGVAGVDLDQLHIVSGPVPG